MRVAILGANGRMGQLVAEEVRRDPSLSIAALVGRRATGGAVAPGPGVFDKVDVVVDFSSPDALVEALGLLGDGTALVSGTTGLDPAAIAALDARAAVAPVLWAANFSPGVAVLSDLVRRAAAALGTYDVEIVEAHHGRKRDAPSGTALALAEAAAEARGIELSRHRVDGRSGAPGPRPEGEIGIHAIRAGDTVGEHTVWLAGPGERLELRHVATSRAAFAAGAVRAARWLVGRAAGRYALQDVLHG
jgi:4-hydroxy-tetrahydrodipicolinate reductase